MFPRVNMTPNPFARGPLSYEAAAPPAGLLDLLPAANRLAIWYAGDGTGGGSYISAADGAAVDSWVDAVASLTPANTGSNRPTYRQSVAAFNNRGAVEFNAASSQFLTVNSGGLIANLNVYTVYVVFATTATATGDMYGEFNSSTSTPLVIVRANSSAGNVRGLHRPSSGTAADITGGSGLNDGSAQLVTFRRSASNAFTLYVNGSSVGTSSNAPGSTTITRVEMGRFGGAVPSTYLTAQVAAYVLYSVDNRGDVEPILNTHFAM